MGSLSEFHCLIRSLLKSTTVTVISGHFQAITLQVGPPTYPAPKQQIFLITIAAKNKQNNIVDTIINIFYTLYIASQLSMKQLSSCHLLKKVNVNNEVSKTLCIRI